jgi:uncharacterized protein
MNAPMIGHLPSRETIESYGLGGFRFGGMSHRGSLLCLPSGMWAWDAETPADIDEARFAKIFEEAAKIDILLVGTGRTRVPLPAPLHAHLRGRAISADPMATGDALRTWNILLAEGRRVAAALLAVD